MTRLQRDRDAAVRKDGKQRHERITGQWGGTRCSRGQSGERETNASGQLTAPEAAGRRETKEPCPMETVESTGAQETNVPEERSTTLRRDGEPLTSAAKRRWQTEADA